MTATTGPVRTIPARRGHGSRDETLRGIFKTGSKTYFNSSRFFPKTVRDDVFVLYAFVRKADDYVDAIPQERDSYLRFKADYHRAMRGERTGDVVVDSFADLARRQRFEADWLDAFFESMEMDLDNASYRTIEGVNRYIYGSAEVVGLMMSRILGLSPEAYPYARKLGAGMQYINFIRDIAEDVRLGRVYFPMDDLKAYGLTSLREEEARARPEAFRRLVVDQIDRYLWWQREGERGLANIPMRHRIAIETASRMYRWTAMRIRRDPFVVYERKVKPSKGRVLVTALAVLVKTWAQGAARLVLHGGRPVAGAPERAGEGG